MIRYTLRCDRAHEFESWFQSSAAYDKQAKRGLVTCPSCGSANVEKSIMAPRIAAGKRKNKTPDAVPAAISSETPQQQAVPLISAQEREFRTKLKELRDHLVSQADNVGQKFPDEARKMHYGEIEHRPIYGQAAPDEAKALAEEGVEFFPLPVLPDERN